MGSTMKVGAGVRSDDEGVGEDSSPRNLSKRYQESQSTTAGDESHDLRLN